MARYIVNTDPGLTPLVALHEQNDTDVVRLDLGQILIQSDVSPNSVGVLIDDILARSQGFEDTVKRLQMCVEIYPLSYSFRSLPR